MESLSPKIRIKMSVITILFNIEVEVWARAVRLENEMRGMQIGEVKLSLFSYDIILYKWFSLFVENSHAQIYL